MNGVLTISSGVFPLNIILFMSVIIKISKKNVYIGIDMSVVDVVNLKMIGGEKLYDYLEKRQFYSKFTHWARLD